MWTDPRSFSRRRALQTVANGFGMFGLAHLLGSGARAAGPLAPKAPHFAPKAKHVIFLFLNGGLSHVDSFDPKPLLTKYNGKPSPGGNPQTERKTGNLMASPFRFQRYGQSGIEVSELFPKIGSMIDDICVIRSMTTDIPNHPPSLLMMSCGRNVLGTPSAGSWITYGLGTENQNLPGFFVLCPGRPVSAGAQLWSSAFLPGVYQGTHVENHEQGSDPEKLIPFLHNSKIDLSEQKRQLSLLRTLNDEHRQDRPGDPELESSIQSMEMAYRMQVEAMDAFDVRKESPATLERYGSGDFARGCLLARRLVERGVRTVQVFWGNSEPWDHHADIMMHQKMAPFTDRPIAALLQDLKASGLFQETLVLIGGEFGRTPTAEISVRQFLQNGRDHDPYGFSMLLAGGGVKGGLAYGATDDVGWRAIEKPVHVHDLHATMLHLLGLDHKRLTYHYSGRDYRLTDVEGNVVHDIVA
ncbi:MAG TPA: DUF1501 domain-containing protein [Bryobacteraceae bacterium]|nr:DUF1501 domain-containing protein [Bryobacteraceae bacterium]